jgi:hypothetical protein
MADNGLHPEDVGFEHDEHLVDAVGNLLRRDPGRVDAIHGILKHK